MAFFKPISSNISYDDFIESVIAGNKTPQFVGLRALKNSDILTAVSIIAGDISRFPIIKKDLDDNIVQDEELSYLLNVRATSNSTARSWKFAMMVNAILTGNSYSRALRDPFTKKIIQYVFYRPSETVVEESDDHELSYTFTDAITGKVTVCKAEDVIHWKFFTHDTVSGRSPLLSLADEISLQENGVETLQRFFKSGFSSGIIKLTGGQLNKEARKKAREEFDYTREGATGGSPLVFDNTQDYTPLEIDTNVLQLINSNNYSTAQIAKCLRIPAYKLAVNSPNQSVKQLNDDYIINDLPYYFEAVTSEHQLKNFDTEERKKYRLEFDTRKITGRNVDEIIKLYKGGIYTGNDALVDLGRTKSENPDMERRKADLNFVWSDKVEEYQSIKRGKGKLKGGDGKNEKN